MNNKALLISYLAQDKEEIPLWLKNYTEGNKVDFKDVRSSLTLSLVGTDGSAPCRWAFPDR